MKGDCTTPGMVGLTLDGGPSHWTLAASRFLRAHNLSVTFHIDADALGAPLADEGGSVHPLIAAHAEAGDAGAGPEELLRRLVEDGHDVGVFVAALCAEPPCRASASQGDVRAWSNPEIRERLMAQAVTPVRRALGGAPATHTRFSPALFVSRVRLEAAAKACGLTTTESRIRLGLPWEGDIGAEVHEVYSFGRMFRDQRPGADPAALLAQFRRDTEDPDDDARFVVGLDDHAATYGVLPDVLDILRGERGYHVRNLTRCLQTVRPPEDEPAARARAFLGSDVGTEASPGWRASVAGSAFLVALASLL